MKKIIIALIISVLCLPLVACGGGVESVSQGLNTYSMQLLYNQVAQTLSGKMQLDYTNKTENVQTSLKFNLYPSAFRSGASQKVVLSSSFASCFYNGRSYGGIEIEKAYLPSGEILKFSVCGEDENVLEVSLKTPLEPQETTRVCIDFVSQIPNANHRFGYGENTTNLGNFFPILCVNEKGEWQEMKYYPNGDPFYSEVSNFNVEITYPSDLVLATSGKCLKTQKAGENLTKATCQGLAIRDFAIVLSKNFQVLSEKVGKITVTYYHYNDKTPASTFEACKKAMSTFSEQFGEYPYDEIKIVETNFCYGGMEFPNLVMVSDSISEYQTFVYCIVHELAHQWWYGLVGNNQTAYAWLDEGLTEYSTALFFDLNAEFGITQKSLVEKANLAYQNFHDVYAKVLSDFDGRIAKSLDEFSTEPEYYFLVYVKGYLLFQTLDDMLGDKVFSKCLKDYFNEYKFKLAEPEDLIGSFEKTSRADLEAFFNNYLNGKMIECLS